MKPLLAILTLVCLLPTAVRAGIEFEKLEVPATAKPDDAVAIGFSGMADAAKPRGEVCAPKVMVCVA